LSRRHSVHGAAVLRHFRKEESKSKQEKNIIMTRNKNYFFPSPWLKAEDLPPDGEDYTIVSVDDEIVGRDEKLKPAVSFQEIDKRVLLNPTQFDAIARLTGENDVDQWAGMRVKLIGHVITIKNRKAGTEEEVHTIQILPASPLVEKPKSTLKRRIKDSEPATAGRQVDDNGERIPF
jgi:hypothetical protein